MISLQFAISIISAMGVALRNPQNVIHDVFKWGYDGVQMLPIRGATGQEGDVLLFENAWNPVPGFWHAFRHYEGAEGKPSNLLDWYFFPKPGRCLEISSRFRQRKIPEIGHEMGEGVSLIELHPGIGTVEEIMDRCQITGTKLVFDPRHFVRPVRGSEVTGRWANSPFGVNNDQRMASLEQLAPYISVVHCQPVENETVTQTVQIPTVSYTLYLIEQCLNVADIEIMVAEYRPPLTPRAVCATAQKMLKTMQHLAV